MKRGVFILLAALLWACRSGTGSGGPDPALIPQPSPTLQSSLLRFVVDNVEVVVRRPRHWEHHYTDFGVVMAEHIDSIATEGQLGGILVHIFVQPLDDLRISTADSSNLAWRILSQIADDPTYIGSAAISDLVSFDWSGLDAAYYLLDNGEGSLSVVIGVAPTEGEQLVTCSLSAPADQIDRVRHMLPTLLDRLTINGVTLEGEALQVLPDPLVFPHYESETPGGSP